MSQDLPDKRFGSHDRSMQEVDHQSRLEAEVGHGNTSLVFQKGKALQELARVACSPATCKSPPSPNRSAAGPFYRSSQTSTSTNAS